MKKPKMTTFSELVEAIDKKWGHTYEDPPEEEEEEVKIQGVKIKYIIIDELPLNDKAE